MSYQIVTSIEGLQWAWFYVWMAILEYNLRTAHAVTRVTMVP